MNAFVNAVANTPSYGLTANGAVTLKTSTDKVVDLFFLAGSARNDVAGLKRAFHAAYALNPELTARLVLWLRDAREGAGERNASRELIKELMATKTKESLAIVPAILKRLPELGRWDDLLIFLGTEYQQMAVALIRQGMSDPTVSQLVCKWLPRKGADAVSLRNALGMTPKQYRKTIVNGSATVEQLMCSKRWSEINYEQVPSVATSRYMTAFHKNDAVRYNQFKSKLVKGEAKVNAGAIFPHDIVRGITNSPANLEVANAQWEALPNFIGETGFILPMVDVSGSMMVSVGGAVTALDAALATGLYCSDKQKGAFKDMMLTFSADPELITLKGNLYQKLQQMKNSRWGMNTNIQAAFNLILDLAVQNRVPAADMPRYILIMSDMEFDACVTGQTNPEGINAQYQQAGYELPKIVFWNMNGRQGNVPVKAKTKNVAMVSGYSPSILTAVLADPENMMPENVMMRKLMEPRYDLFTKGA